MTLPAITATGNLTRDPELRFTTTGKAAATITIACNDRQKDATGTWVDGATCFLDVQLWERDAEQACEHLRKGQRVTVEGRLSQRTWETKDGAKRTAVEVVRARITVPLPQGVPTLALSAEAPF